MLESNTEQSAHSRPSVLPRMSDMDLVVILENHLPQARAAKKSLVAINDLLTEVNPEVFYGHYSKLKRRHKLAKDLVDAQFKDYALNKSAMAPFDSEAVDPDTDFIYLLLEANSRASMVCCIFEEIKLGYDMPFQILSSRIFGKSTNTRMLDQYQTSYHVFYKAVEDARNACKEATELLTRLAQYEPVHQEVNEAVGKALSMGLNLIRRTEELANIHRTGMDFVRYNKVPFGGSCR